MVLEKVSLYVLGTGADVAAPESVVLFAELLAGTASDGARTKQMLLGIGAAVTAPIPFFLF